MSNDIQLFTMVYDPVTSRMNYTTTMALPIVLQMLIELMVSERTALALNTIGDGGGEECMNKELNML